MFVKESNGFESVTNLQGFSVFIVLFALNWVHVLDGELALTESCGMVPSWPSIGGGCGSSPPLPVSTIILSVLRVIAQTSFKVTASREDWRQWTCNRTMNDAHSSTRSFKVRLIKQKCYLLVTKSPTEMQLEFPPLHFTSGYFCFHWQILEVYGNHQSIGLQMKNSLLTNWYIYRNVY